MHNPPIEVAQDESVPPAEPVAANKRWAVIVGALAVAAVWIVATGGPFDRLPAPTTAGRAVSGAELPPAFEPAITGERTGPTPAVPGGSETGQTGTGDFYSEDFSVFVGLPPDGAVASRPVEGEVVADFEKIYVGFVYVYADGRVIWMKAATGSIYEQRLTPKGVDLVRSGAVQPRTFLEGWYELPDLPAGAWADPSIRTYVPARYAIRYTNKQGNLVDPSRVADFLLPSKAEALLRGKERTYDHIAGLGGSIPPATCFEVTIDEARALDDILSNATRQIDILRHPAFEREVFGWGMLTFVPTGKIKTLGQPSEWHGQPSSITFSPLLPQDEWLAWGG